MRVGLTGHYLNYQPSLNKKEADVLRNNTQIFCSKDTANALQATHAPFFSSRITKIPTKLERFEGCLLGGAIGDALGAPIEFKTLEQIKKLYGKQGIKELFASYKTGYAEITDDTQLTIFTVNGLLKGIPNTFSQEKSPDIKTIYNSYQKWYNTQFEIFQPKETNNWIENLEDLYIQKDPGNTCLSALAKGEIGTIKQPINMSKGSGCIMRVAPIGLLYDENFEMAFKVAAENAALTHGHPTAIIASGFFAGLISKLAKGENLLAAIYDTILFTKTHYHPRQTKETLKKVSQAILLSQNPMSAEKAIKRIGEGWTAEEALGISIYCTIKNRHDFTKGILTAVNHSGDSDTTGAITGNLIGTILGSREIPKEWINKVQFNNTLKILAQDLKKAHANIKSIRKRYPYNEGKCPHWYAVEVKNPKYVHKIKNVFNTKQTKTMEAMTLEEQVEYKKKLLKKLFGV